MAGLIAKTKNERAVTVVLWTLVALRFISSLTVSFVGETSYFTTILNVAANCGLFLTALLHSIIFYKLKNTLIFFALSWVVSNFFETLSIATGFPFGHY